MDFPCCFVLFPTAIQFLLTMLANEVPSLRTKLLSSSDFRFFILGVHFLLSWGSGGRVTGFPADAAPAAGAGLPVPALQTRLAVLAWTRAFKKPNQAIKF